MIWFHRGLKPDYSAKLPQPATLPWPTIFESTQKHEDMESFILSIEGQIPQSSRQRLRFSAITGEVLVCAK